MAYARILHYDYCELSTIEHSDEVMVQVLDKDNKVWREFRKEDNPHFVVVIDDNLNVVKYPEQVDVTFYDLEDDDEDWDEDDDEDWEDYDEEEDEEEESWEDDDDDWEDDDD